MAAASDVDVVVGFDTARVRAGMAQLKQSTNNAMRGVETEFRRVRVAANDAGVAVQRSASRARSANPAWTAMRRRLLGVAAAAVSLRTALSAVGANDRMTRLNARIEALTGSTQKTKAATDSLFVSAQALQAPYETMVGSFARLLPAVQDLGGGIGEAQRLSEALMITARASGSSTAEAAASAQQFAQALGSGRLQGDELRSIMENNQQLARLIAEGLGTTVGSLKEMGSQGELTAERVGNAILSQQDKLNRMASDLPRTVGGAWTQLQNIVLQFVTALDQASGASNVFIELIRSLSVVLETITGRMRTLGAATDEALDAESARSFGETAVTVFAYVADAATLLVQQLDRVWTLISGIASAAKALVTGDLTEAASAAKNMVDEITASFQASADVLSGKGMVSEIDRMVERLRGSGSMSLDVGGASGSLQGQGGAAAGATDGEDADPLFRTIEAAEIRYHDRMRALREQHAREMAQPFDSWRSSIQSGIAQMLQSVATGSLRMRDVLRTAFIGLLDITTNILSQLAAQWIVNTVIGDNLTIKSAFARIKAAAAQAGASAVASTAAIPIVGPGLAPAAGAAASTAALAFSSLLTIPSAARGFDVPAGINPLTQIHEREMVLPQPLADTIRDMAGEGGSGGGEVHVHNTISALDARSLKRYLASNSNAFTESMMAAAKKAGIGSR